MPNADHEDAVEMAAEIADRPEDFGPWSRNLARCYDDLRTRLAATEAERDARVTPATFAHFKGRARDADALEAKVVKLEETIRASDSATVKLLIEKAESKKRLAALEAERKRVWTQLVQLHGAIPKDGNFDLRRALACIAEGSAWSVEDFPCAATQEGTEPDAP